MKLAQKDELQWIFTFQGMDKILWGMGRNEGQVEVTNDGATILRSIGVDNPAAKILVDMSKVQVSKERIAQNTLSPNLIT